jgi:hypothetical protein
METLAPLTGDQVGLFKAQPGRPKAGSHTLLVLVRGRGLSPTGGRGPKGPRVVPTRAKLNFARKLMRWPQTVPT